MCRRNTQGTGDKTGEIGHGITAGRMPGPRCAGAGVCAASSRYSAPEQTHRQQRSTLLTARSQRGSCSRLRLQLWNGNRRRGLRRHLQHPLHQRSVRAGRSKRVGVVRPLRAQGLARAVTPFDCAGHHSFGFTGHARRRRTAAVVRSGRIRDTLCRDTLCRDARLGDRVPQQPHRTRKNRIRRCQRIGIAFGHTRDRDRGGGGGRTGNRVAAPHRLGSGVWRSTTCRRGTQRTGEPARLTGRLSCARIRASTEQAVRARHLRREKRQGRIHGNHQPFRPGSLVRAHAARAERSSD